MSSPDFDASTGISRGIKVFDQAGRAVVSDGTLWLLDRRGGIIAQSPACEASAKVHRFGGGCYVTLGGVTYYLRFNIGVAATGAEALLAYRARGKVGRALQALLGGDQGSDHPNTSEADP